MSLLVEQAEKPVPKQVIENGARCEIKSSETSRNSAAPVAKFTVVFAPTPTLEVNQ
ncbi:hypothetical protein [Microcoleus sp. D2_18a_B4]|uniref:hypothetical protein n=1 Tax=Microcoleus sp. D2_18a_B4 TaxID=3055329 RepID=UPI002FD6D84A